MYQKRFPYRIERTHNLHSRAVVKGNIIIVRLARHLTPTEEQTHTEDLLRRIKRRLLQDQTKEHIDPFRPLLQGESQQAVTLASGRIEHFVLRTGKRSGVRNTETGWEIRISPTMQKRTLHRKLWRTLSRAQLPGIRELVEKLNSETLRVPIKDVRLRIATSQWGSCSSKGIIALNTALLFVPQQLMEYVIIHELAHRKQPRHSKRFWVLVETGCPFFAAARKELKQYRLPSLP